MPGAAHGGPIVDASCLLLFNGNAEEVGVTLPTRRFGAHWQLERATGDGAPGETVGALHSLWFDAALTRNLVASLWRGIPGVGLGADPGGAPGACGGLLAPVCAVGAARDWGLR